MASPRKAGPRAWSIPDFNRPAGENRYHVVVIGAGIGGLAAAALLAARGLKVLALEAHRRPGGNCASWRRSIGGKTFVFDSGVQDISGLSPRGPLHNFLKQLGLENRIAWKRVTHLYWRNGVKVAGAETAAAFVANLSRAFPAEADGIAAFFAEMETVYREMYADVERTGGVPAPPRPEDALRWPERHPHACRWMRRPLAEMLDAYLTDAVLKRILSTVSEYVTDDPARLLVEDMAPLYGYYCDGGRYPQGGSQRLSDLLALALRGAGGTLRLGTRATKILTEDGRVAGVETAGGERFFAPLVVSNADAVATLTEMVDPALLPAGYAGAVRAMHRGPTAFLMNLALDTVVPLPARIFVAQDGLEFGLGNPSVVDPSLAPEGCSAVAVLCLLHEEAAAPWLARGTDYAARKDAFAGRLVRAVEHSVFPDFGRHILYREAATPATFAAFTSAGKGAIYGAARGAWRPALKTPVPGLLLVGAGTDTGAGIEAVTVSATRAADLVRPV